MTYENLAPSIKTCELVETILHQDERARKDDKWLCYRVYQIIAQKNGCKVFIPFELFNIFPAFETISRVRRKLQRQGKYTADEETRFMRDMREMGVKHWSVK